nr:uncharacterized protein LOC107450564 isoform X2 [Parasteatoda tepidariorum]
MNDAATDGHPIPEGVPINIGNYTCPGVRDPKVNTECCSKAGMNGCCPPEKRYFYEIDSRIAAIVAITVITGCIFFTVVIAVCCFWSRCPLYTACRVEYSPEIATYESKGDSVNMDTMPVELTGKGSKFTPVIISNGNLDADNNPL